MSKIDRSFVDGLFWRMLVLGMASAALAAVLMTVHFGYSLAMGAVVGALSLRVTVISVSRIFDGLIDEDARSSVWGAVLVLKLAALFFAAWFCVAKLNADVLAFVLGYKMIFPALVWQVSVQPDHLDEPVDETDDTESP